MSIQKLKHNFRGFKLSGIVNSLEERISYANDNSLSYIEFLELLCEDETNSRRDNSYKKRYHKAKLPAYKNIEDFDFSFQPSIDKKLINDACTCQFIADKKNLIFIGNPGTVKTHLSIAIGIKALMKGHKVLFTSTSEMLRQLHMSKADNSYYNKINEYVSPELLVLDELGFKKLSNYSADDFFEVISKRYEQSSTIITTNKTFDQWGDIFDDNILASAIKDRVVHHANIFQIKGPSYRAKSIKK
jgi:DNA replication protein DnaC